MHDNFDLTFVRCRGTALTFATPVTTRYKNSVALQVEEWRAELQTKVR